MGRSAKKKVEESVTTSTEEKKKESKKESKTFSKIPAPKAGVVTVTPWGEFVVLDEGIDWKVTKLKVNPGLEASGKPHDKLEEMWTVVEGSGSVTGGLANKNREVVIGDMVLIYRGMSRTIKCTSEIPLVMIVSQITPIIYSSEKLSD